MRVPKGSIVPLPTPFTGEEARLDLDALGRIIEHQLDNGSHGLSCTGTTGEPSSLSRDERKQVVEFVKDRIAGRVPYCPRSRRVSRRVSTSAMATTPCSRR